MCSECGFIASRISTVFFSFPSRIIRSELKLLSSLSLIQHIRALSSLVSSLLFLNLQETEEIKMSQCSVNLLQCLAVQIVQIPFLDGPRDDQGPVAKIL